MPVKARNPRARDNGKKGSEKPQGDLNAMRQLLTRLGGKGQGVLRRGFSWLQNLVGGMGFNVS